MTNLHDHAIMLLRYMLDQGIVAPRSISPRDLRTAIGLDDNDFDNAENFALQGHLVEGGGGGLDGVRWLTPRGVQYVTEEIKNRVPINLDAERVLRFLIQEIKDNEFLTQDEILKGVAISPEKYHKACQQLEDFDFVELFNDITDEFPALSPTKAGRQAIHRNFQASPPPANIQAGAIFNGSVTGGNIQAVANAIDSEVQQNVSGLSPDDLQKEIEQVLEKLLAQVTEHLTLKQRATYTQMAAEFQAEIAKSQPNPGKLHNLLGGLGMLSDLGGAMDFSQKTFELIVKTGPYIILLSQMIVQLLQNAAH
jgi:hypothetical protein